MTVALPPLSPRLAAVAAWVPEGSFAADVGAGHGRLAHALVASGRCPRVIVIDKSREELAAARLPDTRLLFRQGDGLAPVRPEDRVDTAVVAGLGGRSIARILARRPAHVRLARAILQPQSEAAALRSALPGAGLALRDERLVRDGGRLYTLLLAEPGTAVAMPRFPGLSAEDVLEAGPFLLASRPAELGELWERHRERLARIGGKAAPALARAERVLAYLATSGRAG